MKFNQLYGFFIIRSLFRAHALATLADVAILLTFAVTLFKRTKKRICPNTRMCSCWADFSFMSVIIQRIRFHEHHVRQIPQRVIHIGIVGIAE